MINSASFLSSTDYFVILFYILSIVQSWKLTDSESHFLSFIPKYPLLRNIGFFNEFENKIYEKHHRRFVSDLQCTPNDENILK